MVRGCYRLKNQKKIFSEFFIIFPPAINAEPFSLDPINVKTAELLIPKYKLITIYFRVNKGGVSSTDENYRINKITNRIYHSDVKTLKVRLIRRRKFWSIGNEWN